MLRLNRLTILILAILVYTSAANAAPNISLATDSSAKITITGINASYILTINNTGDAKDNYTLSYTNIDGAVVGLGANEILNLEPGADATVILNVTNESAGVFRVNVTATSQTDGNVSRRVNTITTVNVPAVSITAGLKIKPETLNLASKGKFKAYITLPEGYDVNNINISTVVINGAHAIKGKISNKGGGTLIARFRRSDLVDTPAGKHVDFTVTGKVLSNGAWQDFIGHDDVRVINKSGHNDDDEGDDETEEVEEDDHKDKPHKKENEKSEEKYKKEKKYKGKK